MDLSLLQSISIEDTKATATVAVFLISTLACFVTSSLTDNYSQLDKLWSILPVIYAGIWLSESTCDAFPASLQMFMVILVWGARLTINFFLRGGYKWPPWKGEEDYRWEVVRNWPTFSYKDRVSGKRIMKWTWCLFNFGFISLYQNFLLLCVSLPVIYLNIKCCRGSETQTGCYEDQELRTWQLVKDCILTALMFSFVVVEAIADHQRNVFHRDKLLGKVSGFCQSGLFAYCRHPNYLCENLFWFCLCFYTLDVGNWSSVLNWCWIGTVQYIILFNSSIKLTEDISVSRYGQRFIKYQKEVPLLIPKII